jgi:predicted dehydrogenase
MHRIYLARYFGGNVRKVTAMTGSLYFGSTVGVEGEDTAVALLNFDGGAIGVAHVCIATENPTPDQAWVDIRGTEGALIVRTFHEVPHLMTSRGNELQAFGKKFSLETQGVMSISFPPVDTYAEETKHFLECVAGNKEPVVSAYDGRACVEIVQAAYESARSERTVALPQP